MRSQPTFTILLAALLTVAAGHRLSAQNPSRQWKLRYFYDDLATDFRIAGLAFPSAARGVAVGELIDRRGGRKPKPASVVTSDGGAHWALVPLPDAPRSVFFLDESNGWLVTRNGIWYTAEAGRSWKRISNQIKPRRQLGEQGVVLRVAFLDPKHGFAVGLRKSVYETFDGGRTWKPVEEAARPSSNPEFSIYSQIAFTRDGRGMIVGGYSPTRKDADEEPDWVNPERALQRRQVPTLTLELETRDGGAQWKSSTAPLLGSLARLSLGRAFGLGVFAYADSFAWPSEVYRFDLATGKSESVFKEKDRRVTDALVDSQGRGLLAAVEPSGRLASAPVPGKVRMLRSDDLLHWTEMKVDYRAVARSVMLAGTESGDSWAATDTGMILHWEAR
jgi:Photosynthesis system II assembly factor YCF48